MGGADGLHVIIGAGPSGRGVAERLHADGRRVRVVTRSGRADVPAGVEVVAADVAELASARRACDGAEVVFACIGLPTYTTWNEVWPAMMAGLLAGAEFAGARLVFADDLYMYGPVDGPLTEDLPLSDHGKKPALRSRLTRMWQRAHAEGRVRVAAVRPSDFYGPGVRLSALGDVVVGRAVAGKTANVLGKPSAPHTFAYMPDVVRALVTIADAADDAYGQAWHVPSAPALPMRELVARVYRELGRRPKMRVASHGLLWLAGLFDGDMRELRELLYQWTKPYVVDHSKFAARFWGDYTPLEAGIPETVRWFREHAV